MLKTNYILIAILFSTFLNCSSSRVYSQEIDCRVISSIIDYLKENEQGFKNKSISVFDSTDALPFANFSQVIGLHYSKISAQVLDSIDHKSLQRKLRCLNNEDNPKFEIVFSNKYENLIVCEWFYTDNNKAKNINELRRFKEAKNHLFEIDDNYKVKQVFVNTVQYE